MKRRNSILNTLFILGCISLLFNACKKDDTSPNNGLLGIPKIKTQSYVFTSTYMSSKDSISTSIIYDELGRYISSQTTRNGIPYFTGKIVYTDTTALETYTYSPDSSIFWFFKLNKQGFATSVRFKDKTTQKLRYNNEGFSSDGDSLIIENGNIVKEIDGTDTIITSFYLDKVNTIRYQNLGFGFLGNDNKNLIKSRIRKGTVMSSYSYKFDSQNRVSEQIITSEDYTYHFYYTYY